MIEKIVHYLNLDSDLEDYDRIHETITRDVIFKGTNLWILVFAILVASVGLNMNSTAVIIGAMLISPLMGPINGMGYSVATYNFPLLRIAVKNFTFAVGASLLASTAYFAISPVSTAHSELLARTSPTIYDVLIALFGGLAGIVAISSKSKGNVIPGVAIATALMPPLCTAGYGLATAQWNFFFGAFYLFTINTVFIALSSVVISQILKFPIRTLRDEAHKTRVNRWISIVIIITITPSVYFGYGLVQEERFSSNAAQFISAVGLFEGNYLLHSEMQPRKGRITLVYAGNTLDSLQKTQIKLRAREFGLADAEIHVRQGIAFGAMSGTMNEKDQLTSEINRLTLLLRDNSRRADSSAQRLRIGRQLLREITPMEPRITACVYAEAPIFTDDGSMTEKRPLVVFGVQRLPSAAERRNVEEWLRSRLDQDSTLVYWDATWPR
jgi:uncharacterized hydrophobic protein (TIGR00271 family)